MGGPTTTPETDAATAGLEKESTPEQERHREGAGRSEGEPRFDADARPDTGLRWVAAQPPRRAVIEPLAPARYKVQFTASAELRGKLERLQALMRSSVPDGDLAVIIEAAVSEKLERLEARRFGRTASPRKSIPSSDTTPRTRRVPAAVKRAVGERDGGRCRYVDAQGHRCTARVGLEFHHRRPWALGGDHSPGNVALLCRTHNRLMAEIDYGRNAVGRHRREPDVARQVCEPEVRPASGVGAQSAPGRADVGSRCLPMA